MSPTNFSLITVTTYCHEDRRKKDSSEAGKGAEDELEREALEDGKYSCWGKPRCWKQGLEH